MVSNNNSSGSSNKSEITTNPSEGGPLELKYIIMIACGGGIVLILVCGGLFMCCRSKRDKKQQEFIANPCRPGFSDYNHQNNGNSRRSRRDNNDGPVYAKPNVPLMNHAEPSEPNTASTTFSGAKMDDPAFIELMNTLRRDNGSTDPSENFYYDINDADCRSNSITPSTIM